MKTMKTRLENLLKSGLKAYQIERICEQENIRLSVMGWSKYAVEDGALNFHYHFGNEEYTDVVSVEELCLFDDENIGDFEYPQAITSDIIKALRS